MADRRADYKLTTDDADTILDILTPDYRELSPSPRGTPSDVCKELGIDRRTFNSVISKAVFTKKPTEAQVKVRTMVCDLLYEQIYALT